MPRFEVRAQVTGFALYVVDAADESEARWQVIDGDASPAADCTYLSGEAKVELAEDGE